MKNKDKLKFTKEQEKGMKEYLKYLEKAGKNFKLTAEDLGNLYDLFSMVETEFMSTFKLNKIDKWFGEFFDRLDKIVISEKEEREKILIKLKKEKMKW